MLHEISGAYFKAGKIYTGQGLAGNEILASNLTVGHAQRDAASARSQFCS